jgi:hypothetical protein
LPVAVVAVVEEESALDFWEANDAWNRGWNNSKASPSLADKWEASALSGWDDVAMSRAVRHRKKKLQEMLE